MSLSDEEEDATFHAIDSSDETIVFKVGGIRYEILISSLLDKTGTRLCNLARKHGRTKREYVFNRHPGVFSSVMDYYRSGELHVPLDICGAVVKRELDYWKIDGALIEPCCWTSYSSYIKKQKILSDFSKSVIEEESRICALKSAYGWRKTRMMIWMVLDHPRSSRPAMV